MHFAKVEGRFVAYEEFNTMLTPNTEIAHASHAHVGHVRANSEV